MNGVFMWKRVVLLSVLTAFVLAMPIACGPAKEGEFCRSNNDCAEGLSCKRERCIKRTTLLPPEDSGNGPEESTQDQGTPTDNNPDNGGNDTTQDQASPQDNAPDQSTNEPAKEPSTPDKAPDQSTPEVRPEPPTPDQGSAELSLYDILDPASGKNPKEGSEILVKEAIVTTPLVRLSSTLNVFFVQALKERNGSFKYGGMMVVYDRKKYNVALSLGAIVELKGKFIIFRSTDWANICLMDTDCTKSQFPKCREVFNTRTNQNEKHCTSDAGMPQMELTVAPVNRGNAPVPTPVVVKPSEIRTAPGANAYLGVLVQLNNVVVTNANPDAPKDYSEFSVAEANDKSNDVRVDDLINTIIYTGSKFCFGCGSKPKKPDNSYCLPGDTCQCSGTRGSCYSGSKRDDMRKLNDTWQKIVGVLRYANDNYKLLPRLPTDLQ